jgi:shikimate dehydrogenase
MCRVSEKPATSFKTTSYKSIGAGHRRQLRCGAICIKQLGIQYKLVSRQKSSLTLAYEEIDAAVLQQYTILVNTTPVGMFPNMDVAPELPYEMLTKNICFMI